MKNSFLLTARVVVFFLISLCMSCREDTISSLDSKGSRNGRVSSLSSFRVRDIFEDMQQNAIASGHDVGGTEGLYAVASGQAAFADMAQGYDKKSATANQIVDQNDNVWQLYSPSASSVRAFDAQGITIRKSIDWSTVKTQPTRYTQKKLRFTND